MKYIETASDVEKFASDAEEFHLHTVEEKSSQPKIVEMLVDGITLPMELDTGAAFSIVSERMRKEVFPRLSLQRSTIFLKTYTDERIPVLGQLNVKVKYGSQEARLVLLVVDSAGPTLLGRNWLKYITVDWKRIKMLSKDQIPAASSSSTLGELLRTHQNIFKDELGSISPFKTSLHVRAKTRPRFFYAIKGAIEAEIDNLEQSGGIIKAN